MQLLRSSSSTSGKTIQRYAVNEDGSKESENGKLILQGKKDVYVSPEMFNQANGIDGSQVKFKYLPYKKENSEGEKLQAIWPELKEGTELHTKVNTFKEYDESKYTSFIYETERLFTIMKEALYKDEASENVRKSKNISPEEWEDESMDYDDEIEEEIKRLALEKPERLQKQKEYNQRLHILCSLDAELFPSDCGIMADYVSGQKNGKKMAAEAPAAGQAYHLTPAVETVSSDKNLWGSHHAAIVMADGADHVTFEGAKQTTKDGYAKASFDSSWYFAMYGNKEGQTFDDAYKDYFEPGFSTTKTEKI